jgi:hypothetical protein
MYAKRGDSSMLVQTSFGDHALRAEKTAGMHIPPLNLTFGACDLNLQHLRFFPSPPST